LNNPERIESSQRNSIELFNLFGGCRELASGDRLRLVLSPSPVEPRTAAVYTQESLIQLETTMRKTMPCGGGLAGKRDAVTAFLAAIALSLLATAPLVAHHSFAAEFDAAKPVTLTGAVTKLEWTNPHVWFYIDVKDSGGKVANWGLEMGSPNGLMRAGWTRNSMKVGDVVTVEASRAKDGSNNANARAVTLASTGQRLFAASSEPTEGR
jgi:hypothetical protein